MNGRLVITLDDTDNSNSDRGDEQGVHPLSRADGQDGTYKQPINHYDVRWRTIEDKLKVAPLITHGKPIEGIWY